jgi:selenocysteine-specific elongation factor
VTRTLVVATAGHVDHGKSTLIQALTGTDPDRWAEEKRRGMTIDLGFAHTTLPSGTVVSFIDVPGHVRFLKNMLAGVGAVDACLFVVAATEGWKPQSEEHLRIVDLLGLRHGLVALTKVGLVDEEWEELARLDVEDHIGGTFLEAAPIISVDAPTGRGVEELRAALDGLLADTPSAVDIGRPRLWVDRVFAAKGSGTVVTGTLVGGPLLADQHLVVTGPSGKHDVRVRALQSHGRSVTRVGPGNRVAVNLSGVAHDSIGRGDALVVADEWHRCVRFDASLTTLASIDHEVTRRGAWALAIGSGEYSVRVRILGTSAIPVGGSGLIRVHLPCALPLVPGDRFVLRDHGREETIGGGEVLDIAPVRAASKAQPDRSIERLIAERGWVDAAELARLTGAAWSGELVAGRWVVDPVMRSKQVDALREHVLLGDLKPEGIHVENGRAVLGERIDPLADHPYVRALAADPFAPPPPDGVDRAELRELAKRNLVMERDGVWFAASAIALAKEKVRALMSDNPDGFTVAQFRDATGATRKFVLPLLALLDNSGITRRRGDLRIPGPRL